MEYARTSHNRIVNASLPNSDLSYKLECYDLTFNINFVILLGYTICGGAWQKNKKNDIFSKSFYGSPFVKRFDSPDKSGYINYNSFFIIDRFTAIKK